MAEILVFAMNNTNPDPEKDRAGCYKRGYPVVVQDNGHTWGADETKAAWIAAGRLAAQWHGKFVLFKIPAITKDQVLALANTQTTDDAGVTTYEVDGITPKSYRRREYYVNLDGLKVVIKNTLNTSGEVTITNLADIRNDIKRIRDGTNFLGL